MLLVSCFSAEVWSLRMCKYWQMLSLISSLTWSGPGKCHAYYFLILIPGFHRGMFCFDRKQQLTTSRLQCILVILFLLGCEIVILWMYLPLSGWIRPESYASRRASLESTVWTVLTGPTWSRLLLRGWWWNNRWESVLVRIQAKKWTYISHSN